MEKLIILDRDGVINKDSDHYIRSVKEWHPIPGSIPAIKKMNDAGCVVAVATNQSGIARGYYPLETLDAMHRKMLELINKEGGIIDSIKYCPHGPTDHCQCRKPLPGMIQSILQEQGCRESDTWVVGDSLKDIEAGQAAGCHVALVKTGKGLRTLNNNEGLDDVPVFDHLAAFATFITKQ